MFASLFVGYIFAVGITRPIRGLVESTRAISRAEFHERVRVRGAAEISELAETFNSMAGHIEQYVDQLKAAAEQNRELFLGSIRMLAAAIDEKDPYTRGHSGRVAKYSIIIGDGLGLSAEDLDRLRIAALLHDVGKIGVDDRVLKKPGKLTDEEFELMKQHTVKGANIMRPVSQLKDMLPGIELHHERIDGQGYPYGLSGEQIPIMARIIAVADTFDAITTNRPYQSAMDLEYALERIRSARRHALRSQSGRSSRSRDPRRPPAPHRQPRRSVVFPGFVAAALLFRRASLHCYAPARIGSRGMAIFARNVRMAAPISLACVSSAK